MRLIVLCLILSLYGSPAYSAEDYFFTSAAEAQSATTIPELRKAVYYFCEELLLRDINFPSGLTRTERITGLREALRKANLLDQAEKLMSPETQEEVINYQSAVTSPGILVSEIESGKVLISFGGGQARSKVAFFTPRNVRILKRGDPDCESELKKYWWYKQQ
jgi:hypothetical protein